jgi:glycogen debranching enzyme
MVALIYRCLPPEKAAIALDRIEMDDMTTEWGMRTLSSKDPSYHPEIYHNGVVWPPVTGWTACAEYANNRPVQGYRYHESMVKRVLSEGGMYAEAYRGDRPEPHIACILQGWSLSMLIWVVVECLFDVKPNAIRHKVECNPSFPKEWDKAKIKNIQSWRRNPRLRFQFARKAIGSRE